MLDVCAELARDETGAGALLDDDKAVIEELEELLELTADFEESLSSASLED